MNLHQIAFILSVNNAQETEECLRYINRLEVPEGYEIDVITIQEASSMAEAYDVAMRTSEAKYKIYLHQDVFLIYPKMLEDMLKIFQSNEKIGLMGSIGNSCMPENAVAGMSWDTGKLLQNQVPRQVEYPWKSEESYHEVDVVDGLFIATQYDIDWRKDIFDGWDFYDISQCYEMKRKGYKVVVPRQEKYWCYHDNLYSKMIDFDKYRIKFIQEYQDIKLFKLEDGYDPQKKQAYERMKIELMQQLEKLIDKGDMKQLSDVFKNSQNQGYLFLKEYELISRIYQEEQQAGKGFSIWKPGRSCGETKERLHHLKFLLKALEYDAEAENTLELIKKQYSQEAVLWMIEEYCVWKDKVKGKIFF